MPTLEFELSPFDYSDEFVFITTETIFLNFRFYIIFILDVPCLSKMLFVLVRPSPNAFVAIDTLLFSTLELFNSAINDYEPAPMIKFPLLWAMISYSTDLFLNLFKPLSFSIGGSPELIYSFSLSYSSLLPSSLSGVSGVSHSDSCKLFMVLVSLFSLPFPSILLF